MAKAKAIFLNMAPFPAIIYFQVWASGGRTPENLLVMAASLLAWCALVIMVAYRWDRPGYFDWAIAGYFVVVLGLLWWRPAEGVRFIDRYAATGVYIALFAAAFFPPLLGLAPFTMQFAKKSAPPEVWETSIFIRINLIMTYVWAGIFAVGIILSFFPSLLMKTIIPNVLIIGFGFPFNRLFPDLYLKRLGLPPRAELKGPAEGNDHR